MAQDPILPLKRDTQIPQTQGDDDPIPVLPLPPWLERALLNAARLIIRAIIANLIGGTPHGTRNVQPPDSRS